MLHNYIINKGFYKIEITSSSYSPLDNKYNNEAYNS